MAFPASLRVRSSVAQAARPHVALLVAAALAACSDAAHDGGDASESASEAGPDAGASAMPTHDAATGVLDSGTPQDAGTSADTSTPLPSSDAAATDTGAPTMPTPRPTACAGKPLPPRALGKSPPFAVGPESAGLAPYWPTTGWRKEDPEKLGFDAAKLAAAVAFTAPNAKTQAVFVVRHGYVAAETYSGGFSASMQHESYSMAKSFSSGLIGIAIGEGKIKSTDEKVCQYYPMQWDCSKTSDPRSRITIEHAMNLTTGLRWSEDWRSNATGTNDAYNLNLLDTELSRESVEEPGKTKRYSTGDPALLSGILQQATGMTAYQYGKTKVFDVIGATSIRWNADTRGRTTTYAGLQATARDYAKYGYLYLNRGMWDGKQVVPAEWVDRTTQAKNPCEDWNQWLWHINPPIRLGKQPADCDSLFCLPTDLVDLPPEIFFAEGVNGQFVFVAPSADLVVVRLANDQAGSEHWDEFARGFLLAIFDALK